MGFRSRNQSLIYLNEGQIEEYSKIIPILGHLIITHLLLNGISLKEILNLRPIDIRYWEKRVFLKEPLRFISIDTLTNSYIVLYMLNNNISFDSTEKLITTSDRNIRLFVKEYGQILRIPFDVKPHTLYNSYFVVKLISHPDTDIEFFHLRLGYSDIAYTREIINYFRNELFVQR